MLAHFVAIDFETANTEPSSVCAIGVVIVRDREIVDSFYSLICPEPNYFSPICQRVHGLRHVDTDDAPSFPDVWQVVENRISNAFVGIGTPLDEIPFVAHNARFDERCLRTVFRTYQMEYPEYPFYDTLRASRRHFQSSLPNHQLQTVAAACGYDLLHHHHALADAEACAAIALRLL